jgi:hypothetical protein
MEVKLFPRRLHALGVGHGEQQLARRVCNITANQQTALGFVAFIAGVTPKSLQLQVTLAS